MKTTKKTINPKQEKKTTKVAKPKYVVDLTGVTGEYDTMLRFALCKYENKANTKNDLWVLK
jgi:DNA-binding Lrp family transcriptional regulator